MSILSPTDGKVTDSRKGKVHIWMSPIDNHLVFSPVSGKVEKVIRRDRKVISTIRTKSGKDVVFEMGKGILPATIDCNLYRGKRVKLGEYVGGVFPFGSHVTVTGDFGLVDKGRVEAKQVLG